MSLSDAELAAQLAATAGRILLQVRDCGLVAGQALGKTGDQTANQFLCHALRAQRPADGLLSEEEKDNAERLSHSRVWIIDPVDGTREYGEARSMSVLRSTAWPASARSHCPGSTSSCAATSPTPCPPARRSRACW